MSFKEKYTVGAHTIDIHRRRDAGQRQITIGNILGLLSIVKHYIMTRLYPLKYETGTSHTRNTGSNDHI